MLTEPYESDSKKKWPQLTEIVKESYRQVNESMNKSSSSFKLTNLLNSNGEQTGIRIYCLGSISNSTENSLLYCDIENNENLQFNQSNNSPIVNSIKLSNLNSNDLNNEDDNLELPTFKWNELICSSLIAKDDELNEKSLEEKLQLERKRMLVTGISSYEFHEQQKRFVFCLDGSLHYFDDNAQAPYTPVKLPSKQTSAKINPSICPTNANLVAYVSGGDLFVLNIETETEIQLTNNKIDQPNRKLTSGLPSYIVQEEFSRYVGFWWQPVKTTNSIEYKILFEQIDETDVELIKICSYNGTTEEYRYPKPGKNNATSILKLATFKIDPNTNEIYDMNVNLINDINDFKQIYSEHEYLINCDWFSEDAIVVQLMNRKQQNLLVFLISLNKAFSPQVIYEEINEKWINISQICEFIKEKNEINLIENSDKSIEFIWTSQETGYRHLYKISVKLNQSDLPFNANNPLRSTLLNKIQLTHGNWEVNSDKLWLDSKNRLIYFIGLKDSPLENQLYVISLDKTETSGTIKKLTTSGYSNGIVAFNLQDNIFINIQSSISKPPFGFLNFIQHSNNAQLPTAYRIGYTMSNKFLKSDGTQINCIEKFEMLAGFSRPELFSYQLKESGDIVYGLIYKPDFMQADKKYPVVLEVYGGPCVQLVTNNFKSVRTFNRHLLASQGYVVCVLDCRGSANRGMAFESYLNRRLGQVEVNDQVEVLSWLASNTNYIDLKRVAVHGFSYGGYLSLLCYANRPDIFRCCIAGAPVSSWLLYDTGYTERYMDTPENNPEGYAKGSVLNHVSNFPNEDNRLLIIHGLNDENVHFAHTVELIHELVKVGRPYSLQIYPRERHSMRKSETSLHYRSVLLSFLNQNL